MTATAGSAGAHRPGRNVDLDHLVDRAKFVRLETVRLTKIAGAGHYSSTFSAAELFSASRRPRLTRFLETSLDRGAAMPLKPA